MTKREPLSDVTNLSLQKICTLKDQTIKDLQNECEKEKKQVEIWKGKFKQQLVRFENNFSYFKKLKQSYQTLKKENQQLNHEKEPLKREIFQLRKQQLLFQKYQQSMIRQEIIPSFSHNLVTSIINNSVIKQSQKNYNQTKQEQSLVQKRLKETIKTLELKNTNLENEIFNQKSEKENNQENNIPNNSTNQTIKELQNIIKLKDQEINKLKKGINTNKGNDLEELRNENEKQKEMIKKLEQKANFQKQKGNLNFQNSELEEYKQLYSASMIENKNLKDKLRTFNSTILRMQEIDELQSQYSKLIDQRSKELNQEVDKIEKSKTEYKTKMESMQTQLFHKDREKLIINSELKELKINLEIKKIENNSLNSKLQKEKSEKKSLQLNYQKEIKTSLTSNLVRKIISNAIINQTVSNIDESNSLISSFFSISEIDFDLWSSQQKSYQIKQNQKEVEFRNQQKDRDQIQFRKGNEKEEEEEEEEKKKHTKYGNYDHGSSMIIKEQKKQIFSLETQIEELKSIYEELCNFISHEEIAKEQTFESYKEKIQTLEQKTMIDQQTIDSLLQLNEGLENKEFENKINKEEIEKAIKKALAGSEKEYKLKLNVKKDKILKLNQQINKIKKDYKFSQQNEAKLRYLLDNNKVVSNQTQKMYQKTNNQLVESKTQLIEKNRKMKLIENEKKKLLLQLDFLLLEKNDNLNYDKELRSDYFKIERKLSTLYLEFINLKQDYDKSIKDSNQFKHFFEQYQSNSEKEMSNLQKNYQSNQKLINSLSECFLNIQKLLLKNTFSSKENSLKKLIFKILNKANLKLDNKKFNHSHSHNHNYKENMENDVGCGEEEDYDEDEDDDDDEINDGNGKQNTNSKIKPEDLEENEINGILNDLEQFDKPLRNQNNSSNIVNNLINFSIPEDQNNPQRNSLPKNRRISYFETMLFKSKLILFIFFYFYLFNY
ncbi:centromere protein j [Anaeramoeba flamelloides]|uniref:Centromere protein j n=1 Tax=Anaeramoeba flamelloides TaxID=1746091 RepID=A0AAV7YAU5_9EUKA|nr:centromere protein j [Anaeramoeba flamelloides]